MPRLPSAVTPVTEYPDFGQGSLTSIGIEDERLSSRFHTKVLGIGVCGMQVPAVKRDIQKVVQIRSFLLTYV